MTNKDFDTGLSGNLRITAKDGRPLRQIVADFLRKKADERSKAGNRSEAAALRLYANHIYDGLGVLKKTADKAQNGIAEIRQAVVNNVEIGMYPPKPAGEIDFSDEPR